MAKYTTQYGLPQSMVDYLNQPLPDISGIFTSPQSTSTSGTTAGTTAGTTEDESSISEEGIASLYPQVAASDDDDDYSVYNPDPARLRTLDQYSPYAYRQAMANSGIGIPSGILSDSSYLYPQNQFSGIFNLIPGIGTLSTIGKIAKSALPINPRAVLENEALGAGIRLDDIGRIVQGPGSINTAENIFAGYNLSKITPETIQKRKDMINKNMKDPKQKKAKLNALDEFEEKMFGDLGITQKTKEILTDKYATDPRKRYDKYKFTGPNVQGDFTTTAPTAPTAPSAPSAPSSPYGGGSGGLHSGMSAGIDTSGDFAGKGSGASGPAGGGGGGGGSGGCFLKGTLVTMSDGSKKEIQEIDLGDEVAIGGKVFATGKFLVNNLHDYKGIKVSGSHMVNENNKWVRVEDSEHGKLLGDEEHTVYVFGAENRRILINDILFTDYFEVNEQDKLINNEKKFFNNWKIYAKQDSGNNVDIINAN